jgi:hypothetical protein
MTAETAHAAAVEGTVAEHPLLGRLRRTAELMRRRPGAMTALAGLAGVVLTLVVMPPPMYGDSTWVWRSAQLWPNIVGEIPVTVLHHAMRLGTVLPVRVAQEILGDGQIAWVTMSALFMGVFTAGVFALGRSLFSTWVGFGAVGIVALHPYFTDVDDYTGSVNTSTGGLVPDAPASGLFALGVAAFVVASRRTGARQVRWLLAGGACMGLAYLTREFVAFMFVLIPVAFVLLRIPWRRLIVPAGPMAALFGVELVVNAFVFDDPFARLTVAGEHGGQLASPVTVGYALSGFSRAMTRDRLGLIFVAGLVLIILGILLFRDRRLMLLMVWFLSLWVPLTALGGLIDPWEPNLRHFLVRYWTEIFAPLAVGGLATIGLLVDRVRRSGFDHRPVAAGMALVGVVYLVLAAGVLARVQRDEDWRDLRTWLAAHPEVTALVTDDRTAMTAGYYALSPSGRPLWTGTLRSFRHHAPTLPVDVIGDTPYLQQSRQGALEKPDPADGWRVVWRSTNGTLTIWDR